MRTTRQFSITPPLDMAAGNKTGPGAYIRAGEGSAEREAAVEKWLRDEVMAGHEEYLADPSQAVPADAVLQRIKARRTVSGGRLR
jgi:antitoxin ParD1/3/4